MPPFLYRCPNTGGNVQTWAAEIPKTMTYLRSGDVPCVRTGASGEPKTGKVLGCDDE